MSTCRSCGAPVLWAVTPNSKAIPLNPEPVENGNLVLDAPHPMLGAGGEGHGTGPRLARPPQLDDDPDGARYVSHFVTCPNAALHRKR